MHLLFNNVISVSFYILFFFVPLVLFPKTSELFEFNKMVLTYVLTVIITSAWIISTIKGKKKIFRRTIIDIPLILLIFQQAVSTLVSLDVRTSLLGYYSRYHGGLASTISYAFLYWAFVSNMDRKKTLKCIYIFLISSCLVSLYGVLQHFGIDKDIWVQDVQNRVFSTLGQPNWLAAWITALIPITWGFTLISEKKENGFSAFIKKNILWILLSNLLFLTLIYTKSRSGFLGLLAAEFSFWIFLYILSQRKIKALKKTLFYSFSVFHITYIFLILIAGSPWTPNIREIAGNSQITERQIDFEIPALEIGGSKSSEIRKIVWKGAVDIWKNYPVLGTGPETFAYAYYQFRPQEHNLVSEWDFLYNKAHNEYLNILSTSGALGILAYFTFILFVFVQMTNDNGKNLFKDKNPPLSPYFAINLSLLAGIISILVSNFFGFSVVPVALQFFLYPAFAVCLSLDKENQEEENTLNNFRKVLVSIILIFSVWMLFVIGRYWYADYLFSVGRAHNNAGNLAQAQEYLNKAVAVSSKEAAFWEELSKLNSNIALSLFENDENELSEEYLLTSIKQAENSIYLSPNNVNIKRSAANVYLKLSIINPNLILNAQKLLYDAIQLAPTDAKLHYNLALIYARTGNSEKAKEILSETIEMKDNYRNARLALALILKEENKLEEAKYQLEYILKNIDPNDKLSEQELEKL